MLNIEDALRSLTEADCINAHNAYNALGDYFDSEIPETTRLELKGLLDKLQTKFGADVIAHALVCKLM